MPDEPFITFQLPSGALVHVQSTLTPPGERRSGVGQATGVEDKVKEAWGSGVPLVQELAAELVDRLKAATESAEEVKVEFGVNISGKSSVVLVQGETQANLKVTISWKG